MSYTVSLQQRIQQLKKAKADLPDILYQTAKNATQRAIETAKENTPPAKGERTGRLAGTNMLTGELEQSWGEASKTEPVVDGSSYTTVLGNDMDYASYVDQGHRLNRHFVPGLYIDENGQLNRNMDGSGGIIVGTKTKYVKGEFMVDKAREAYEKAVLSELDKKIQEMLK